MCHQSVALVQRALDRQGLATVSLSILEQVTEQVIPSRVLLLPYPLGYPLGIPGDRQLQRDIVETALSLCGRSDLPLLVRGDF